jgi:hypothetical protein
VGAFGYSSEVATLNYERVADWLHRHPFVAAAIVVASMLEVTLSGAFPFDQQNDLSAVGWALFALMGLSVVGLFALPRSIPTARRIVIRWAIGYAPFLYGFSGLSFGQPVALVWIGFAVSVAATVGNASWTRSTDLRPTRRGFRPGGGWA